MAVRKKVAKKKTPRRKMAKRDLIDTGTNKLYVRRNKACCGSADPLQPSSVRVGAA